MSNINFEKILNNVDIAVVITDTCGKIVYTNKSFCNLFSTDDENAKKQNILYFLPNNTNEIQIKDYTYSVKKYTENELIYYSFAIEDTKMEKVYSDFISTVSHELRTPLTSIRGFADTMLLSYDKLDKEQIKKFMGIIKDQSNRLIKLVENLLSISKIQVQQSNLVYKSVNPKNCIEQIICMVKNQYPNCKFSIDTEENFDNILVDENKFQQIIINLLDNAAKYSYDNGDVSVKILNDCKQNFVNIKIQDHGIGIEPQNLNKIFEKFARIENHLTRKTQGSGLGLYIVKSLVEKMGGQIKVKSSVELPNSGTTFEILFPAVSYTSQSQKKIKDN